MTQNIVEILNFKVSNKLPLFLIAGPCSIESKEHAINHAGMIKDICKKLNATEYITGSGSKEYLEEEKFKKKKIQINYLKLNNIKYFQENSKKKFIKDLSILDYLFNSGFEDFKKIQT